MKYEKPEVSLNVSALAVVQSQSKSNPIQMELHSKEDLFSVSAYEADE